MSESPPVRLAYDVWQAAWQFGDVGEFTIRRLIRSGELKVVRVGRHDRIPHAELVAYLERNAETRQQADIA